MFKSNWICCLQQNKQFIGLQSDIFVNSDSIYYDEYFESLIGIEVCSKCKATYASYMIVEFTIPKIYFHIPISFENYNKFKNMEIILKEDLFKAKEANLILIEREMTNNSVWEWEEISEELWSEM